MVEAAGVEQFHRLGIAQVTHFTKSQKRENGTFRRFEVHGGYTDSEFFRSPPPQEWTACTTFER